MNPLAARFLTSGFVPAIATLMTLPKNFRSVMFVVLPFEPPMITCRSWKADSREGKEKRAQTCCRALNGEPRDSQAKVGLAGLRLILPTVWRGSPAQCGIGWRKQEPAKNQAARNLLERRVRRRKPNSNIRMHQHNQRGLLLLPSNMSKTQNDFRYCIFFRNSIFF